MEPERNEVYERIPWETLTEEKRDRQWLMFAVAGAIVLGALAYSFMSNRTSALPAMTTMATAAPVTTLPPPSVASPTPALPLAATTSPVVTAEADLYAVHPERVIDRVAAHAEWFAAEYLTFDGSEAGKATLTALMPTGMPLPTAAEGTRVFVEWVRATSVEETGPAAYRVTVLARTLAAAAEDLYERQAPLQLLVDVTLTDSDPQVLSPPQVIPAPIGASHQLGLTGVPDQVAALALEQTGASEVIGGVQTAEGAWQVVLIVTTPDGVSRPASIVVTP